MSNGADALPGEVRLEPLFSSEAGEALVRVTALGKSFRTGEGTVEIFRDLSFSVRAGEIVAVVGESGAGKSSLLHLLAALDRPSSGEVWYGPTRVDTLRGSEAARFRNEQVGYVWQFHYLLPEFTALENVAMPLLARGERLADAANRARALLTEVGLAGRETHRSGELSGGEQQRVSMARALVTSPRLLLADEPTGDLDERTSEKVMDLLRTLHAARGLTSVLVTHNSAIAQRCDRILRLHNGQVHEIEPGRTKHSGDLPGNVPARS